jgi:Skp family chaperone for outer membrane proteins
MLQPHSPDESLAGASNLEQEASNAEHEQEELKSSVKREWDDVARLNREIEAMPGYSQTVRSQAQHEASCLRREQEEAESWLQALRSMFEYEQSIYRAKHADLYCLHEVSAIALLCGDHADFTY